jgi:ribosomal protein S18 acetylase RimI-like enzyme
MVRRPAEPQLRQVTASDVPAVTAMLVRSFDDDPVANFMFAGDRRRHRGLRSFFTSQLRHQYLRYGHVVAAGEMAGVAVWGPPERERNGLRELFELLPTAPYLCSTRMLRALRLLFEVDRVHPTEPHWYLATLGTAPECQGQGFGSALLRSMLNHIDTVGEPAYLESSKQRNVSLYARFGFEVIDELRSVVGSPPIWQMWREPRPPEG